MARDEIEAPGRAADPLAEASPNHYIALMSGDGLFNNLSEETIVKANPLNYPLASPSHE